MGWRAANSITTLRNQINTAYPGRNKISDGIIGDAAHAASISDHNPNDLGVVCAFDITHDPAHGLDIWDLAERLKTDDRVKYLIANRKIFINGSWQPYTGVDPHTSHLHVSVGNDYDNPREWKNIKGGSPVGLDPADENLKQIGLALLSTIAGPAIGNDPKNVATVINDYEQQKLANFDAQRFKALVVNSGVWAGDLDELHVVKKGTAGPVTEAKVLAPGVYKVQ